MRELAQTANRRQLHRLRKIVDQFQIRYCTLSTGPTRQAIHHFLRSHAARHAFPARFIAKKRDRVQRHVEHACPLRTDYDGARTQHGTDGGERLEVKPYVYHGGRKVSRRWPRWRERLKLLAIPNSAGVIENHFRRWCAHRDDKNTRLANIPAYADKLQARSPA